MRRPGVRQAIEEMREAWRDADFRRFAWNHGRGPLVIGVIWFGVMMSLALLYVATDWAWAMAGAMGLLFGWKLHRAASELLEHELQKAEKETEEI